MAGSGRMLATLRILWVLAGVGGAGVAAAADWPALDPADLALTAEPLAPAAAAIVLYRQVDRDDELGVERNFLRIKVLNEEGRKYANVEIAFPKPIESVGGIEARTISPDGTITKFDGTIYESPLVKARGVRLMAKTFTLPGVQVGSIIDYRFRSSRVGFLIYDSEWQLSAELFTKRAAFSLQPNTRFPIVWRWPVGLPAGSTPPERVSGKIQMTVHDVPAFVTEDYMPPQNTLRFRVEFVYSKYAVETKPDDFWRHYGKERYRRVDSFIDHRHSMEKALAQIITPGDAPEVKLAKIYARVQQLRNISYEPPRSEEEQARERILASDDAGDVWDRGYGSGQQMTWLFLALARAAGLEADAVQVSTRDRHFFQQALLDANELNKNVVRVKIGNKEVWADPGVKFAPLGVLPWAETKVTGRVLAKDGGSWVTTPLPSAEFSRTERRAVLTLDEDGSVAGKLKLRYFGLQALTMRLSEANEDSVTRKQYLEKEVKRSVPTGIDVTLTNAPDWDSSSVSLTAEFDLRIPGWAAGAGSRWLLPTTVFAAAEKAMFTATNRRYNVYLSFPYSTEDDVSILIPATLQAATLPDPVALGGGAVRYRANCDFHDGHLNLRRHFDFDSLLIEQKSYDLLRDLFQQVRTADERQAIFARDRVAAAH